MVVTIGAEAAAGFWLLLLLLALGCCDDGFFRALGRVVRNVFNLAKAA